MGKCIVRPFYTPHQLRHDQDDILFINEHWGEIKEAYFQVLEALKAPTIETPDSGCKCSWIKKTFIPTYFYISRDSSVADVSEEEIQNFFNNIVVAYSYDDKIERFSPLVKLNVDGDVYALPIPHVTGSNTFILYSYSFTGIVDDSSYPERTTPPFYDENYLRIYANTGVMYGNKISLTLKKDSSKEYLYLSHDNTETDLTPITFEFLETVRQCTTEVEDKPEDTPDTPDDSTPEGVLTDYTVKVRFTPKYWYEGDVKYAVYCFASNGEGFWKEAVKVENNVVWYTFTEEEVNSEYYYVFTSHNLEGDVDWSTNIYQTADIEITFDDTVRNDVVTIDHTSTTAITVGSAYV